MEDRAKPRTRRAELWIWKRRICKTVTGHLEQPNHGRDQDAYTQCHRKHQADCKLARRHLACVVHTSVTILGHQRGTSGPVTLRIYAYACALVSRQTQSLDLC